MASRALAGMATDLLTVSGLPVQTGLPSTGRSIQASNGTAVVPALVSVMRQVPLAMDAAVPRVSRIRISLSWFCTLSMRESIATTLPPARVWTSVVGAAALAGGTTTGVATPAGLVRVTDSRWLPGYQRSMVSSTTSPAGTLKVCTRLPEAGTLPLTAMALSAWLPDEQT